jgi:hypothetical protein
LPVGDSNRIREHKGRLVDSELPFFPAEFKLGVPKPDSQRILLLLDSGDFADEVENLEQGEIAGPLVDLDGNQVMGARKIEYEIFAAAHAGRPQG